MIIDLGNQICTIRIKRSGVFVRLDNDFYEKITKYLNEFANIIDWKIEFYIYRSFDTIVIINTIPDYDKNKFEEDIIKLFDNRTKFKIPKSAKELYNNDIEDSINIEYILEFKDRTVKICSDKEKSCIITFNYYKYNGKKLNQADTLMIFEKEVHEFLEYLRKNYCGENKFKYFTDLYQFQLYITDKENLHSDIFEKLIIGAFDYCSNMLLDAGNEIAEEIYEYLINNEAYSQYILEFSNGKIYFSAYNELKEKNAFVKYDSVIKNINNYKPLYSQDK